MSAGAGAALVVHDLKNELGALEAALERLALAPAAAAASAAHDQCRSLRQRLVMYLTLYGGADELRAHCEDESPSELIAQVARRHDRLDLPVAAQADADAPSFWYLDRRLVGLALDAAVHNAQRFARSAIRLGALEQDGHLVLSVDDDGPGLDPACPSDAFSTGLGTALCRAVARAHGCRRADGGVRLANRPEGGARFELWLPT
ncbi:MAG: ATP-binding protein [Rubrivivax sp.]|nr:ATP-binding protein [Rubrivivax sp.]